MIDIHEAFMNAVKVVFLVCLIPVTTALAQTTEPQIQREFIKGFSFGCPTDRHDSLADKPEKSLELLAATGSQWLALYVTANIETASSTDIKYAQRNPDMASDDELRHTID